MQATRDSINYSTDGLMIILLLLIEYSISFSPYEAQGFILDRLDFFTKKIAAFAFAKEEFSIFGWAVFLRSEGSGVSLSLILLVLFCQLSKDVLLVLFGER